MQQYQRLRRSEDFQRLRQVGIAHRHRLRVLSFSQNELSHNRYGFIVGKQLGKAVIRNRTRRRLREVIRALDPRLKPGHDVVLIARQPLAEQPFDVVARTVNELFLRAELFREGNE
ncbi:MAG: ribonuclease P protein component [Anaerolineae bacterium]|nr:ribonuclease P protein component [Anaerolineae bacterium]